jgi:hypothetical protein
MFTLEFFFCKTSASRYQITLSLAPFHEIVQGHRKRVFLVLQYGCWSSRLIVRFVFVKLDLLLLVIALFQRGLLCLKN